VQNPERFPFGVELQAGRGKRRGYADHADSGRDLHNGSEHREPTVDDVAGARPRDQSQSEAPPEAAAQNGDRDDLVPSPAHEHSRQRAPEIPVSAEGPGRGIRRRSLVRGHHVYPDAARARLPVRGDGLAFPQGAGVGGE